MPCMMRSAGSNETGGEGWTFFWMHPAMSSHSVWPALPHPTQ